MPIASLTEKSFRELEIAYKIIHDTVWKQRQQPLDDFIDKMAMLGLTQFRRLGENLPLSKSEIFIRHVQAHLEPDQFVICKICGKSMEQIFEER